MAYLVKLHGFERCANRLFEALNFFNKRKSLFLPVKFNFWMKQRKLLFAIKIFDSDVRFCEFSENFFLIYA